MKAVVELNDSILREAMRLTGENDTSVLVDRALQEMIRKTKRMNLTKFAGKVDLPIELDTLRG